MAGPASGPWSAHRGQGGHAGRGQPGLTQRPVRQPQHLVRGHARGQPTRRSPARAGGRTAVRGSPAVSRSVIRIRYSPYLPTVSGRGGSGQVSADSSRTRSPSSRARLTVPIAPSVGQPSESSPGRLTASVAVVITASAPNTAATLRGQRVRAGCMAADHRDRAPGRLVHADHGGVGPLAVQQRGDQPDGGADREEADQPVALGPGPGQRLPGGPVVAAGLARPGVGQPLRGRPPAASHRDQADHRCPPHPRCRRRRGGLRYMPRRYRQRSASTYRAGPGFP